MNEVAHYMAQVRTALADLPPAVRDELLEDLPEHLAEVAAEAEGSLAERLGPPAAYAAELRVAAGAPTSGGGHGAYVRLSYIVDQARARLQAIDARTGPIVGYERTSDFLRLLRPGWWVLRGYLVAMAIAYLVTDDPIGLLPRFDAGDRTVTGLFAVAVFALGSIWLGRRASRLPQVPRLALGVGTALLMLPAILSIHRADDDAAGYPQYQEMSYNTVDSVYGFDERGRPLFDVRFFDQAGNPVTAGLWRCVDSSGAIVVVSVPSCADPQPLDWPRPFPVSPLERESAEPAPTPSPSVT